MSPLLVFLESNTTGTGRLFAKAARAEGCEPVLLTRNPELYPFATEDAIRTIRTDTADEYAVLAQCCELAETAELAGLTSTSDYFVLAAARLAARLSLPAPSASAIEICRDKQRQYDTLQSAGVRMPATEVAETAVDALPAARRVGLPVVMKPAGGSGSVGVRLCQTENEVEAHAAALFSQTTNERGTPIRQKVILQELIEGPEFSVETLGGEVVGITRKYVSAPPVFVEIGHDFPAALPMADAGAIAQITRDAIAALDLRWGAAHTELRLSSRGPVIIEVNPRLAGGFIPELLRRTTGIDIIRQLVRRILGRDIRLTPDDHAFASIRFIIPGRSGRLAAIAGQTAAREIPHVCELSLYRPPGTMIALCGDFHDRIGHVMTSCRDAATARDSAARALERLVVELD